MFDVPGRPTSVTIIGWYLILAGAGGLLSIPQSLKAQKDPGMRNVMEHMPIFKEEFKKSLELPTEGIIVAGLMTALHVPLGIYVLLGANWARFGYIALNVLGIATVVVLGQPLLFVIPSIFVSGLILIFFFRKPANDFFTRRLPVRRY